MKIEMKVLISLFLLCFIVAINGAPRVVGGSDAPDGKYPYQVSIRRWSSHMCGGSIISSRWILTAAHCLQGQPAKKLLVHAGTNKLFGGHGTVYHSEFIVHHEKFSQENLTYDIGLVRVNRDIEFNDHVQPINLPSEDFTKKNYPATLTGWGSTKLGGNPPNDLQQIELKVIEQKECDKYWSDTYPITESHICTLTKEGQGACHGDSGGPLVADSLQIGVVSFGYPCAKGRPDVFTRVYTFLDWIENEVNKF